MTENHCKTNNQPITIKELHFIAREKNIKYYSDYTKNQLEEMLGLEISEPNEKYEKCCREKIPIPIPIIVINKTTGEILKFKSITSVAKNFNKNPGSIKYRINIKKDLKFNRQSFLFFDQRFLIKE